MVQRVVWFVGYRKNSGGWGWQQAENESSARGQVRFLQAMGVEAGIHSETVLLPVKPSGRCSIPESQRKAALERELKRTDAKQRKFESLMERLAAV